MLGSPTVIAEMNSVLTEILTSINQTFLHARIFKNWGLFELDEEIYEASIRLMKAADDLIARVLFLEGLPNLQELGKLNIGEDTVEIIASDLKRSLGNVAAIKKAIALCETEKDFQSRELLEDLLEKEEEFVDWLETQQSLIEKIGIENYLAANTES